MSENILRQLWFDCYALDMSPAKVARRYDAKFGVLPLMLLCPVGHMATITEQEEEMGKHKKWWWVCRCGFVVTEVVYLSVLDVASCPECGARYQTFTRSCHGPGIERAGREKNGRDE